MLHHVRRLAGTGFLEALPPRQGRRGVPYRSTGKSWSLHIEDASEQVRAGDAMLHAFLDELADAGGELVDTARLGLRLRDEDREELSRRVSALLEEFKGRSADSGGQWWSVFFAIHRDRRGTPG